jgi:hypothetical protein
MNKSLLIIFVAFLLVIPPVLASDFAYIVKDSSGIDNYLLTEIQNIGYSYDILFEKDLPSLNLTNYRLLIIGDDNLDSPENIPIEKHRSLVINSYDYYSRIIFFDQLGWSANRGTKSSPTNAEVLNSNSRISVGLPSEFKVYTVSDKDLVTYYLKGKKPTGIETIITTGSDFEPIVATLENGKYFLNGKLNEQRNLFFGATKPEFWTPQTKTLFSNSISWLLIGEDKDSDGFFSDSDCNDFNATINPAADEIPYDGVDQDCDGFDLTDVDEDNYNSIVIGGLDCNDFNGTINPDNPDPYENCMNDAPS